MRKKASSMRDKRPSKGLTGLAADVAIAPAADLQLRKWRLLKHQARLSAKAVPNARSRLFLRPSRFDWASPASFRRGFNAGRLAANRVSRARDGCLASGACTLKVQ